MNYPEEMCAPMRSELVSAGFVELKTPESVSDLLSKEIQVLLCCKNYLNPRFAGPRPLRLMQAIST